MIPNTESRLCERGYVKLPILSYQRLQMASNYLDKYASENPFGKASEGSRRKLSEARIHNLSWPTAEPGRRVLVFGLIIASFSYGTIHALAWNATFPTVNQRMYWRISTVFTMVSGAYFLFVYLVFMRMKFNYWSVPIISLTVFGTSGYMVTHCYLIIDALIALPYSPPDVYQVVSWAP